MFQFNKLGVLVAVVFLFVACSTSRQLQQTYGVPEHLPEQAFSLTYDIGHNYWCLVPTAEGQSKLMLLEAGHTEWVDETLSQLPASAWERVVADNEGFLWLSGQQDFLRLDIRHPDQGWTPATDFYQSMDSLIAQENNASWKNDWRESGNIMGSNHDLRGDVYKGAFYMAGGVTAEYGYPLHNHAYDKLYCFNPKQERWTATADLGRHRVYCATAPLQDELWVLGGDVIEDDGTRYTTTLAQKIDPHSGLASDGVKLNYEFTAPLAFNANQRLYILGYDNSENKVDSLIIESIGIGESEWRVEPKGPLGSGALYGCKMEDTFIMMVSNRYLVSYNVTLGTWETIAVPIPVRSPQVAHYKGEIWIMGGRDQKDQSAIQIYNKESQQWREGPHLPRELAWGVGFNLDEELYVAGGAAGPCYSNRTFIYKGDK